jgi:ferrochelatase
VSQPRGIGILLVQLGTPAAPTTPALRRYLRQFLSDPRVIDLPRSLWLPMLHLRVLRTRPARSAELYLKIWSDAGSPLVVTTREQADALSAMLDARGVPVRVAMAMRYGEPSIARALAALQPHVDRLLVLPLYPQYASATTGSSLESVYDVIKRWRVVPAIRTAPPYFDDRLYLNAVATVAAESLATLSWRPDQYLISFHGLPRRYADLGDPYPTHCARTADRLIDLLQWPPAQVTVTFQSRFGREEWLQPYTDVRLRELARRGARVAVICPGFVADCLETLEEINITNREYFLGAGGAAFHYIPCVNAHPEWTAALGAIVERELAGWDLRPRAGGSSSLAQRHQRIDAAGAARGQEAGHGGDDDERGRRRDEAEGILRAAEEQRLHET